MVHRTTKVCSAWRVISPLSTKGPRKLKRSPEPRAPLRAGGSRGSRMLPSRIPVAWKNAVCRRRWIKMGFRGHPFWSGLGKPLGQPPCFGVLKTKLMRVKMAPEKWIGWLQLVCWISTFAFATRLSPSGLGCDIRQTCKQFTTDRFAN